MYPQICLLALLIVFNSHTSFAQKSPIKFGKISEEEILLSHYEGDSSAGAVVLADVGSSRFKLNANTSEWSISFTRHTRIKIFSKNEYDVANIKIPFYDPNSSSKEKILTLKAVAYNMENGKLVKTVMKNDAVFEERINKYWKSLNFAIPNVKQGTIIEYSYILNSEFIRNLREWEFQRKIPVVSSQYTVTIPEFFNYQLLSQGYEPINKDEKKFSESYSYKWKSLLKSDGTVDKGTSQMESESTKYFFSNTDIPAFKEETHLNTSKNYVSRVSFELMSVQYPNEMRKNIMGSWNNLNATFLESSYFGQKVNQSNFLKKIAEEITLGLDSKEEKIIAIFDYVKKKVAWNGHDGIYLNDNFRDPLEEGKGSVAEINLLLTSLLQKADIEADPVLISTVSNGFVRKQFAISDQFNYVICVAQFDNKQLLLDATEHYLPIGVLPKRCLNDAGWIVSETRSGWLSLDTDIKSALSVSGNLKFDEDGKLVGELTKKYSGYNSRPYRYKYFQEGEEKYLENVISKSPWTINSLTLENPKNMSEPFVEKYDAVLNNELEGLTDIIYMDLILSDKQAKNPFVLEERKYPVVFDNKIEEMYYVTLELPEGYKVESLPEAVAIALPEKGGKFILQVTQVGQKITVMSKLNIDRLLFAQFEYPHLKEFFNRVVQFQNQQLVLKSI